MNVKMMKLFEDPDRHEADQGTGDGKKHRIMDHIPFGQDSAISMKALASIFHTGTREIRQMVRNARLDGEVIVGDEYGYYQPTCEEDLIRWIRKEEAAATGKFRMLQSAKDARDEHRYPSIDS